MFRPNMTTFLLIFINIKVLFSVKYVNVTTVTHSDLFAKVVHFDENNSIFVKNEITIEKMRPLRN